MVFEVSYEYVAMLQAHSFRFHTRLSHAKFGSNLVHPTTIPTNWRQSILKFLVNFICITILLVI